MSALGLALSGTCLPAFTLADTRLAGSSEMEVWGVVYVSGLLVTIDKEDDWNFGCFGSGEGFLCGLCCFMSLRESRVDVEMWCPTDGHGSIDFVEHGILLGGGNDDDFFSSSLIPFDCLSWPSELLNDVLRQMILNDGDMVEGCLCSRISIGFLQARSHFV
ncbi:hypothetical protein Dimus_035689 [Dionaea muscipula]